MKHIQHIPVTFDQLRELEDGFLFVVGKHTLTFNRDLADEEVYGTIECRGLSEGYEMAWRDKVDWSGGVARPGFSAYLEIFSHTYDPDKPYICRLQIPTSSVAADVLPRYIANFDDLQRLRRLKPGQGA